MIVVFLVVQGYFLGDTNIELICLIKTEMGRFFGGGGQVQKPSQALNFQRLDGCAFSNRHMGISHWFTDH